ncbi:hypothetical protein [Prosthecochloris sp. SCSIO W1103]|uniref:hypothetical protein n=1 Tax=Prosthecochloris sp. SCSIO W1103 TaxID=2992244 RepID=UPI00223E6268|nr:hypothetical protein [Prosthecochloris sp. SCSIO W1103]UZJ36458.1 hypothetical protein OO005_06720 [Prosthecochloris sp. SCSIO W1103]
MDILNAIICVSCIVLFVVLCIYSRRASRDVNTVTDFLSFGPDLTPEKLERTFEASNASFTTAFLSLFLFASYYGQLAFAVPIGFCVGIFFYVRIFLPRKFEALKTDKLYPLLVADAAKSPALKVFISMFIVLSLWLFTFAELQGFASVASSFAPISSGLWGGVVPIVLILAIAYYALAGGYRAVIATDILQIWIIRIGIVSVAILAIFHASNTGMEQLGKTVAGLKNPFGSIGLALLFCTETLIGFLFSQLLYYDNWQRLGAYCKASIKHRFDEDDSDENCQILIAEIQSSYNKGAIRLLLIYAVPIILGFSVLAGGSELSAATLVGGLQDAAGHMPIVGSLLLIVSVLMMASALMSTADTYCLGATHALVKGVFPQLLIDEEVKSEMRLGLVRVLTGVFLLSLIPVLLLEPHWETFFLYLFYSANGLVGPVMFAVLGRSLNSMACKLAILFGFAYPAVPYLGGGFAPLAPYPGIVPVLLSLILVGLTSKPKSSND